MPSPSVLFSTPAQYQLFSPWISPFPSDRQLEGARWQYVAHRQVQMVVVVEVVQAERMRPL
jgi:hypothetical protein